MGKTLHKTMAALMFALFTPALASAQESVPYSAAFDGTQQDWQAVDKSNVLGKTWTQWTSYNFGGSLGSLPTVMLQDDGYSDAPNDYYVSPAITVEAGKTYAVKLHGVQQYAQWHGTLSVEIGTSLDDMTSFKSIGIHEPETENNAEFNDTYKFTAESDGTVYVAFHALPYEGMSNYVYYYLLDMGIEESTPDTGGEGGGGTENPDPGQPDVETSALPYYQSFVFENAGDTWKTVDKSANPGDTFVYRQIYTSDQGYSYWRALQEDDGGGNDYFISPAFRLEAGKTYVADFTHAEYTYGGTLYLELGTDRDDVSTFSPIFTAMRQTSDADNSKSIEELPEFTVPQDGVYYLAFHATNEGALQSDYVYVLLKDFLLKEKEESVDPGDDITQDEVVALPYSVDFTDDEAFSAWRTLDASSKSGSTWAENSYGYLEFDGDNQVGDPHPCAQITTDWDSDINDYLVSPVMELKEGKTYVVKVHAAGSSSNTANLSLELTNDRRDASTYIYQTSIESPVAFDSEQKDREYEVEINKDGRYYFALHARTWENEASANLNIFSFSVAEKEEAADVAVDVPYTADFTKAPEGADEWSSWTSLDRSDYANSTWRWGAGSYITFDESYMHTPTELGSYNVASESSNFNDYLVSPALNLESGKTYVVTAQGFTRDYSDVKTLSLELGTEKKVSGSYVKVGDVVLNEATLESDYQLVKDVVSTIEFTVDESGTYYLALHGTADEGKNVYAYVTLLDIRDKNDDPFTGIDTINAAATATQTAVYTLDGRRVGNLSTLAKGTYIVRMQDASGKTKSIKVLK